MGAFSIEPTRERPDSPPKSYGVPRRGGTFIEWAYVVERLTSAEAYWIATVTPANRPHVVPIWGCVAAVCAAALEGDAGAEPGPDPVRACRAETALPGG